MLADLRTYILADTPTSSLLSTRLYLQRIPAETALPHARYFTVAEDVQNAHNDGTEVLNKDLVQLDVYAGTATEALAIKEALKLRLNSKAFTQGSTVFGYIEWQNATGDYEATSEEFSQTITVSITWSAA